MSGNTLATHALTRATGFDYLSIRYCAHPPAPVNEVVDRIGAVNLDSSDGVREREQLGHVHLEQLVDEGHVGDDERALPLDAGKDRAALGEAEDQQPEGREEDEQENVEEACEVVEPVLPLALALLGPAGWSERTA